MTTVSPLLHAEHAYDLNAPASYHNAGLTFADKHAILVDQLSPSGSVPDAPSPIFRENQDEGMPEEADPADSRHQAGG